MLFAASSFAWILALGDYVALGLHRVGSPAGPFMVLASPMLAIWLAALVSSIVGAILVGVLARRYLKRRLARVAATLLSLVGIAVTFTGPQFTTEDRFEIMKPALQQVASLPMVVNSDSTEFYDRLPPHLAFVAVTGLVSTDGHGTVFIPQWAGWRENAGGYFYAPNGSPELHDMWGNPCFGPVPLGDDWWHCGMD